MIDKRVLSRDEGEIFGQPAPMAVEASKWRKAFSSPEGEFLDSLKAGYGTDPQVLIRRCSLYIKAIDRFTSVFGDEGDLYVLGVPSRINWEGHHVDHQGGYYNSTTDEREMVAVVRARKDRIVRLDNISYTRFPSKEFSLADEKRVGEGGKDWADYVKGALVYLQRRFPEHALAGMDMVIGSDIPVGAGLSSSHALVLASTLASIAVNGLTLDKRDGIILVQEGEWFTGSRTGLGDQSTMIYGKRGKLFSSPVIERDEIEPRYVDLPEGLVHLLVNSFTEHQLQGEEKLAYNARVFAYKAAFPLVLEGILELGAPLEQIASTRRLAEINPSRFSTQMIYKSLMRLPDLMSLDEARARFKTAMDKLTRICLKMPPTDFDQLLRTYFGDGPYPSLFFVKGVAMYGLAECRRSMMYADLIERGDMVKAGALVYTGHNGDRVTQLNPSDGVYEMFMHPVTNDLLSVLLTQLESGDLDERERAKLEWQPGDYRASIDELDEIVDISKRAGAISASLTGAGLGGVVTVIIEMDMVYSHREMLFDYYERQEDAEMGVLESETNNGAISLQHYQALVALIEAKRRTRILNEDFSITDEQQAALDAARKVMIENGMGSLVFLGADYYRTGIKRNISIAGAGFCSAPGS